MFWGHERVSLTWIILHHAVLHYLQEYDMWCCSDDDNWLKVCGRHRRLLIWRKLSRGFLANGKGMYIVLYKPYRLLYLSLETVWSIRIWHNSGSLLASSPSSLRTRLRSYKSSLVPRLRISLRATYLVLLVRVGVCIRMQWLPGSLFDILFSPPPKSAWGRGYLTAYSEMGIVGIPYACRALRTLPLTIFRVEFLLKWAVMLIAKMCPHSVWSSIQWAFQVFDHFLSIV
jgi:hypothetical protein